MNLLFILLQHPLLNRPSATEEFLTGLFIVIVVLFLIYLFTVKSENIGNWSIVYPSLNLDPEEYYKKIIEILTKHEVPNFQHRYRMFIEGGIISNTRLYLEVKRGDYIYHICAAPWGTDFFFSWWMRKRYRPIENLLVKIPVLGPLIKAFNETSTYYKLDTDAAFNASVQHAVKEAINGITDAKGLRRLTEAEWTPDVRSVIKKA